MPAGNICGCGWYRLFEAIPHSRSSALYLPRAVLFERLNSECEIMVLVEVYSTFSFYSGMGATFCLHKDISCIFQMFARLTNGRCTLWVHRVRECVCACKTQITTETASDRNHSHTVRTHTVMSGQLFLPPSDADRDSLKIYVCGIQFGQIWTTVTRSNFYSLFVLFFLFKNNGILRRGFNNTYTRDWADLK